MSLQRSAWREPMVWLITLLPAAAVAASIGLLVQAIRTGGDDAVIDEVHHTAQMQVADVSADERAGQQGLSAILRIDGTHLEVLPATGAFDRSQRLHLHVAHPARAAEDIVQDLQPSERGWQGQAAPDDGNDWILQLDAQDGSWRLKGRLLRGQKAALLQPALPGH